MTVHTAVGEATPMQTKKINLVKGQACYFGSRMEPTNQPPTMAAKYIGHGITWWFLIKKSQSVLKRVHIIIIQ